MRKTCECSLCDELLGEGGVTPWGRIAPREVPCRVISESHSYVAIVTIGPIVRGHCLIVPREHRGSVAAAGPSERREAKAFLEHVSASLRGIYGSSVLLFEHGVKDGSRCKPCSVGHAHWHVVPTAVQSKEMLIGDYSWQRVFDPYVDPNQDYLLVGDARTRYWVTYPDKPVPSQALRIQLALRTGRHRSWDWRVNTNLDLMLETIRDLEVRPK